MGCRGSSSLKATRGRCGLPGAGSLVITTLTPTQYTRLYEALPGVDVFRPFFEGDGLAPLGVVFEPEPGVTDRFSVAFDLAETGTSRRTRSPSRCCAGNCNGARLGFHSESRSVWLDAPRLEDLGAVRTMIDLITAERRR